MKFSHLSVVAVALVTSAGFCLADDWNPNASWGLGHTDILTVDVAGGAMTAHSSGAFGDSKGMDGGLIMRVGVALCLNGTNDGGLGVVMNASSVLSGHSQGNLELGLSICKAVGDGAAHSYISASAGSLRVANMESDRLGANIGEIFTVVNGTRTQQGVMDISAFLGTLDNTYWNSGNKDDKGRDLAVGARVRLLYRSLARRLEVEGGAEYAQAVVQSKTRALDLNGAVRWLAVRLPDTNAYVYLGLQGNMMYAQNAVDVIDSLVTSHEELRSQTAVQGTGMIGIRY